MLFIYTELSCKAISYYRFVYELKIDNKIGKRSCCRPQILDTLSFRPFRHFRGF